MLVGDPWSFPYDHYSVNLTIKIPLKESIIYYNPVYAAPVNISWYHPLPKYTITSDPENTFLKIYMRFERNEFSYTGSYLVFPILLVFFLVGAISLLEPKSIEARTGISIGIFAFVFAYVTLVTDLKPQYVKSLNIVTLADMMLNVLLIATTAYTISSVIGYNLAKMMNENMKEWIKRIHTYRSYDILATWFAELIVILFLIHDRYSFSSVDWVYNAIIIIVGLAWGILIHIIYTYIRRIGLTVKRMDRI